MDESRAAVTERRLDPEGRSSRHLPPPQTRKQPGSQRAQVLEIMRTEDTRSRCVAAVAGEAPAAVPRLAVAPAPVSCPRFPVDESPAEVDDDPRAPAPDRLSPLRESPAPAAPLPAA